MLNELRTKRMKKTLMVFLLAAVNLAGYAQTKEGDSSFGLNVGYGFDSENVTLGVDYRYNLTNEFRLSPSMTYYVKKDHHSAWAIDMNAHYVVEVNENFGFYPLAGLDLSFWSWDLGSVSKNRTRLGVNLGLGGEVYASEQISIGLEFKYQIIKTYDQALFAVRMGYNF